MDICDQTDREAEDEKQAKIAADEAEAQRIADEASQKAEEELQAQIAADKAEAERVADEKHRENIEEAIVIRLVDKCQISTEQACAVASAISLGLIPHVTINY